MKWMRLSAVAVAALAISLAFFPESPANAQIQTVPRETGAPPIAAPTGDAAEGQSLAAPVGEVQAEFVGPQTELQETFTPLGLFMRADWVVKAVMLVVWLRLLLCLVEEMDYTFQKQLVELI